MRQLPLGVVAVLKDEPAVRQQERRDTTLALRSFRERDITTDTSLDEDQGPLGVVEDVEILKGGEDGDDEVDSKSNSEEDRGEDRAHGRGYRRWHSSTSCPLPVMHGQFQSLKAVFNGLATSRKNVLPTQDLHRIATAMTASNPTRSRKKKRQVVEVDLTADTHTTPESSSDFKCLQLSGIDKARETAKRALSTINLREEVERLNIWIALMNLEIVYGTEESVEGVFKDATRHCLPKINADEQFKRTCKDSEQAPKFLPRSLQNLEKRERRKDIVQGNVDTHTRRWDIWSIYIDLEGRQSDLQITRNLLDRMPSRKLTSCRAKISASFRAFFKKWVALEKRIGEEQGAEEVKGKAVKWTQRAAAHSAGDEA
ncbi:hypothetical protein BJY52DRAFT_1229054 [Lactarius psammicola]|nr:hypothetical protein BJY52DRAFT_1229054 [Lactarius psammicola]